MSVDRYEVVIGCEIHCQLLTKTKAFCACENRYGGMPDTRVCPVCLGLPGAMPRVSKGYVELGAVAGLALNCNIARFTKFDRKHYFYPDLAKGYQITQYDIPLCSDGYVDLPFKHLPKEQQPGGEKYRGINFIGENCKVTISSCRKHPNTKFIQYHCLHCKHTQCINAQRQKIENQPKQEIKDPLTNSQTIKQVAANQKKRKLLMSIFN